MNLRHLWEKWKLVAHTIGLFQSRLILTIFYFVLLLPFGIVCSFKKKSVLTGWIPKENHQNTMQELQQQ